MTLLFRCDICIIFPVMLTVEGAFRARGLQCLPCPHKQPPVFRSQVNFTPESVGTVQDRTLEQLIKYYEA